MGFGQDFLIIGNLLWRNAALWSGMIVSQISKYYEGGLGKSSYLLTLFSSLGEMPWSRDS